MCFWHKVNNFMLRTVLQIGGVEACNSIFHSRFCFAIFQDRVASLDQWPLKMVSTDKTRAWLLLFFPFLNMTQDASMCSHAGRVFGNIYVKESHSPRDEIFLKISSWECHSNYPLQVSISSHRHWKQTDGYQRGKEAGRDKLGVWD